MERISNFIGGKPVPPVSGAYFDNIEPATGAPFSSVPDSDERDVELAVSAARASFPEWAAATTEDRSAVLKRIGDLIERDLSLLADVESQDSGKPVSLARTVDIPRAALNFRFFASAIIGFASEFHNTGGTSLNYTLRQPVGVVGAISPWNLPLYLFTWKVAPALATGNCVVGKPSELTPMTAWHLSNLCTEAGLPPGVLNIVHGYGRKVGSAISSHPSIPAITFTGGTKTGRDIAQRSAPLFKKLSLEMGGKNPTVIFADCTGTLYEEMIATTIRSSFSNQGEICLCGSRIFIERPLYETFRKDFTERTQALKIGDPSLPDTDLGAINSAGHCEKVLSFIALAKEEGGTILSGGEKVQIPGRCRNGSFIQPTVIEGLPHDCRTNQEEIFGPVVTILPFETEEEVIGFANGTEYGLAAIVWSSDLRRAHRVASRIEAGIIWINCWMVRDLRTPFGGMKNSGLGREGGVEALRFFTEPKNVCVML